MNLMDEKKARVLLVEYGKKLLEEGLVQGTWGNLSIRLDDRYMVTTPSGLDYARVTPEDMVKVEIETLTYGDGNKPTSEKGLHGGAYTLRHEIGALIHTHSKYASIFAAAGSELIVEDSNLKEQLGLFLYCADYALPGSKALTKNTISALGSKAGCIMAHHGMVAVGSDIADAFNKCKAIEKAAEYYIEKRI